MKKGISIYVFVWVITVASFWLGLGQDAMGYSFLAFYAVLPAAGLICPAIMSKDGCSFKGAIIGSVLIGFAYSAAQYLTFSLANMILISFSRINPFSIEAMLGGAATALIGFGIGALIKIIRGR